MLQAVLVVDQLPAWVVQGLVAMAEAMLARLQPLARPIQALVVVVAWEPVGPMLPLVRLVAQVSSSFVT
jgi:hypothetical protein